ncbi:hypothetical protein ON010_g6082 [Phytophthora cinnamomi]|nr:hypothetical protein ON010_g6082 [Phytophthora cinnamomi]
MGAVIQYIYGHAPAAAPNLLAPSGAYKRPETTSTFTGSDTEAAAVDVGDCYSSVRYNDYNHVENKGVVVYGKKNSTMLNFRDCAPKISHRIRAQFNINQDFYRESFDPSQILSEHGSEGKSGNIFYFTANMQFMVKSVPKEEFDTLRAILRGIIDYSILLGVCYAESNPHRTYRNGITSHDQSDVYYLGIVDMLQRYNWRWTVQRWFLGLLLCKDTHDVSAVPPDEYATRLADFVRDRMFALQGSSDGLSFRHGRNSHLGSDRTGESGLSSDSSQNQSFSSTPHTSVSVDILEPNDFRSIEMEHLSVFSASSMGAAGIEPSSSSSSPSMAYSSVCESPVEATPETRKTTTFFV